MAVLFLKPGREKPLLRRHPWIFSGAVAEVKGHPQAGDTVEVRSAVGEPLGTAAFSPHSQIRARMWSWNPDVPIDEDFFRKRLSASLSLRSGLIPPDTDAYRLVNAESDGLPGLVVDRYGDTLVVQFLTAGAERWRQELGHILMEISGFEWLFERSDADVRELEGLPKRRGWFGSEGPATQVEVKENGHAFMVDIENGQKTGFYLDQRDNRQGITTLASNRRVLNVFAYTGGFAVYALAGGAREVISVETSSEAMHLGQTNLALNGYVAQQAPWVLADAFYQLRDYRDRAERFDLIVLDPPKFAPTSAHTSKAVRGYKDINLLAFKLLRPGGILVTFSCSGGVNRDLFQKIVTGAALDARVEARLLYTLSPGADHPVALNFPEGAYLKGLVCLDAFEKGRI